MQFAPDRRACRTAGQGQQNCTVVSHCMSIKAKAELRALAKKRTDEFNRFGNDADAKPLSTGRVSAWARRSRRLLSLSEGAEWRLKI